MREEEREETRLIKGRHGGRVSEDPGAVGQLKWGPEPAQYLLLWQQMATLELHVEPRKECTVKTQKQKDQSRIGYRYIEALQLGFSDYD